MASKLTPCLGRKQISARNQSEAVMRSVLRTYAKTANQRLRELEKTGFHEGSAAYRQIRDFWHDNRSFMDTTKSGEIKFRTNTRGMTKEQLRQELLELDTFLFRAKTSTVKGTQEHYKKIKESIGTQKEDRPKSQELMDFFNNMSMKEFTQFWGNVNIKQMIKAYGSEVVMEMITEAQDKGLNMGRLDELFNQILNEDVKELPIKQIKEFIRRSSKTGENKRARKWLSHVAESLEEPSEMLSTNPADYDNDFLSVDPIEDIPF